MAMELGVREWKLGVHDGRAAMAFGSTGISPVSGWTIGWWTPRPSKCRARRAKTDRVDVEKLLALLVRAVLMQHSSGGCSRLPIFPPRASMS
jgi:hypothetical protein